MPPWPLVNLNNKRRWAQLLPVSVCRLLSKSKQSSHFSQHSQHRHTHTHTDSTQIHTYSTQTAHTCSAVFSALSTWQKFKFQNCIKQFEVCKIAFNCSRQRFNAKETAKLFPVSPRPSSCPRRSVQWHNRQFSQALNTRRQSPRHTWASSLFV